MNDFNFCKIELFLNIQITQMDFTNIWKIGDIINGIYLVGVVPVAGSMVRCLFMLDSCTPCAIIYHMHNKDWIFFIESTCINNDIPRILNYQENFTDAITMAKKIVNYIEPTTKKTKQKQ